MMTLIETTNLYDCIRVSELPDHMTLLQDSQDCIAMLESIGSFTRYEGDSYFVEVLDGDYGQVWRVSGFVPYNDSWVKRIR